MTMRISIIGVLYLAPAMAWPASSPPQQPPSRTKAEIDAIIDQAGRTPPPWWDSTPLRVPPGLDLTWRQSNKWEPQKHIGQYLWDIINPNPSRWREGIRLVHHTLTVNKDNRQALERSISTLARMYFELLQDYPRAAFWERKVRSDDLLLANCYWKLGNKQMAVELIQGMDDDTRFGSVIKLWAEMGELDKALQVARRMADDGAPDIAWVAAGDACRMFGRYREAMDYYNKALAVPRGGKYDKAIAHNHDRARSAIESMKAFEALDLKRVPDGAYRASAMAFTGPLEIEVAVRGGRIENVRVTRHTEKQFYASIEDTTAQIIQKQGVRGVDATSGATVTSQAIINATAKALAAATR